MSDPDHVPTPHTVRHCTVCAYKQGLIDGGRNLAICVLIADRWRYDEAGHKDLVEQAERILRVVEDSRKGP